VHRTQDCSSRHYRVKPDLSLLHSTIEGVNGGHPDFVPKHEPDWLLEPVYLVGSSLSCRRPTRQFPPHRRVGQLRPPDTLAGAGVSKGAGLPSAGDIEVDLVRQIAQCDKATVVIDDDNAEQWYADNYGRALSYSSVIEEVAHTARTAGIAAGVVRACR